MRSAVDRRFDPRRSRRARAGRPAGAGRRARGDGRGTSIVVGGGHNGLTAAAYLAKAGKSVLVLEARDQLGGACTLERTVRRPRLQGQPVRVRRRPARPAGDRRARPAPPRLQGVRRRPGIWCPFDDGTSYAQFLDHDRTVADMRDNGFSDADIEGQFAYEDFFDRHAARRCAKAPATPGIGDSPDRAELEELLGHDPELIDALFETSIADVIDRYMHRRAAAAPRSTARASSAPGPGRGPGHRVDQAHALPGHARGRADGVGLRRGRHGPDLVRDRRSRGGGGRGARRRRRPSPRSSPARASCSRAASSSAAGRSSRTPTRRSRSRCSATRPSRAFRSRIDGVADPRAR